VVKLRDSWFDEKQRRLYEEEKEEFKIEPFKPRFVPPELIEVKITRVYMPYLGEVYKCEECGCIMMTENDANRHVEYHRSELRKQSSRMTAKLNV